MEDLEVICELMVDFDNLEEHEFHVKDNMVFQGWSSFFHEYCGPVYPDLVKEFWVYASIIPKAVVSFVHGRFFAITEDTLRILLDLKEPVGAFELSQRETWADVLAELYPDVTKTKDFKDLKNIYKVRTKILLGCFYHRKATHSPKFVNRDQQYILYCIGTQKKVDAPYLIFNHLWNAVRDSRDSNRTKKGNIIPFGRIITNILV